MKFVPNAVSTKIARQILVGRKHSPVILFGAGITGVVTSTVLACKATLKIEDVLEEATGLTEQIKSMEHTDYSERDRTKDLAIVRTQTAVKLAKLYSPALIVGVASICALGGSHHIMSKRNAGLMAAYAALEKGFNDYRKRVVSELGEEGEFKMRFPHETVQEQVVDKNGKTKTVDKSVVSELDYSQYARFFDETVPDWSREAEYNMIFLRARQCYANDMLRARGHVFLNEVYDMLGIDHSKAGAVVGWVLGDDGDNFIDFGVFNGDSPAARSFVNGQEGAILLDFNVDGVIYDKI